MSESNTDFPQAPFLPPEFFENQRNFPRQQLDPYKGQFVAWNWQGARIVGHAPTREELWQQLDAAGIDSQRVVFEYIDDM
jgi:hypothetical protein